MTRTIRSIAWLIALFAAIPASAASLQDLDALERRLIVALGADIGQPGGPVARLDRRMRLMACPSDVLVEPPVLGAAILRCQEIGWRIRVPLTRDNAIVEQAARMERAEPVVRRGDPVEISLSSGGFTVSSEALAEQDGAPGQRIRVRRNAKSPPMMVEVVAAGKVRVPGFNGI